MIGPISRRRAIVAAAGGLGWTAARGQSERFPGRPVRIVVPYAVGVGPDIVARALGEILAKVWGQPVVVENKPGASGIVAFADLRRVPPDGCTLYLADTATLAVNPLINDRLPYDPQRDLAPITLLFRATFAIIVGGASRFSTIASLLDDARREAGRVSYASLGNGHASQMAIESLAYAAGVRLLHVPFKDAGALFTAVAASDVDFTAFSMNTVAGLVARGRLRALAVAARRRLPEYPQLPTLAEAGAPAVEMHPWAALVAPAGVPPAILAQLHDDIVGALESPELRRRVDAFGFELTPSTPRELRLRVEADLALYAPLVRDGRVAKV